MPVAPTLTFRPAVPADAPLLRRWDEDPAVVASDPNDDWRWEIELAENPDWREQFIVEADGHAAGFLQLIDPAREESRYWGNVSLGLRAIDLWIGEAEFRNRGIGTRMMQFALDRCFADPSVTAVLIDPLASNSAALRFYGRLGFIPVERRRFGLDDCLVHRLDRDTWAKRRPAPDSAPDR